MAANFIISRSVNGGSTETLKSDILAQARKESPANKYLAWCGAAAVLWLFASGAYFVFEYLVR